MMRVLSIVALVVASSASVSVAICPTPASIGATFGCPGATQACLIDSNVDIDDGCTLDFGNRPVTLQARMRILGPLGMGAGTMTIRARSFTIAQSGLVQGVETEASTQGFGGMVTIVTAEDFIVQGASQGGVGMIDVTGGREGGVIDIDAARDVLLSGRLKADGDNALASGGSVEIRARRNVRIDAFGRISVIGGNDGAGGGDIDISAEGNLEIFSRLMASGADGGAVDLSAGNLARITDIESVGEGDAGCGGCLNIQANNVEISGWVRSDGTTGTFMSGGSGGFICVGANFGNLTVTGTGKITADGAQPDGAGGEIALEGEGDAMIAGPITAIGPAGETCGGGICLDIQGSIVVTSTGLINASGGDSGGDAFLSAARDLTVMGAVRAAGTGQGSFGGAVGFCAGLRSPGTLLITNTIDAGANRQCSTELGCGEAGTADFEGCDITLTASGEILADAPTGGDVTITGRHSITINGSIDAEGSVDNDDGTVQFRHPMGTPPILTGADIAPDPDLTALPMCTREGQQTPPCVLACPVCGDGVKEFPETCDDGPGTPMNCDGCSRDCRVQNCDDGLVCTVDSCDALLGCNNVRATIPCFEPTPTVTPTVPTPTSSPTPSVTPTASETRTATTTPTITPTPSVSPTASSSPSETPTSTVTQTPTSTPSPSDTPSPTSTATMSATPTASTTPTLSPTPSATTTSTAVDSPTATQTPVQACSADCNGDGSVDVNELIVGVGIALGSRSIADCDTLDSNLDSSVTVDELIAAVGQSLDRCA